MKIIRAGCHLFALGYLIKGKDHGGPGLGGMTLTTFPGEEVTLSPEEAEEFRAKLAKLDADTAPAPRGRGLGEIRVGERHDPPGAEAKS